VSSCPPIVVNSNTWQERRGFEWMEGLAKYGLESMGRRGNELTGQLSYAWG